MPLLLSTPAFQWLSAWPRRSSFGNRQHCDHLSFLQACCQSQSSNTVLGALRAQEWKGGEAAATAAAGPEAFGHSSQEGSLSVAELYAMSSTPDRMHCWLGWRGGLIGAGFYHLLLIGRFAKLPPSLLVPAAAERDWGCPLCSIAMPLPPPHPHHARTAAATTIAKKLTLQPILEQLKQACPPPVQSQFPAPCHPRIVQQTQ